MSGAPDQEHAAVVPAGEAENKAAVTKPLQNTAAEIAALHLAAAAALKCCIVSSKLNSAISLPLPLTSSLDGESRQIILPTGTSRAAEAPSVGHCCSASVYVLAAWRRLLDELFQSDRCIVGSVDSHPVGNCSEVQCGPQATSASWTITMTSHCQGFCFDMGSRRL